MNSRIARLMEKRAQDSKSPPFLDPTTPVTSMVQPPKGHCPLHYVLYNTTNMSIINRMQLRDM